MRWLADECVDAAVVQRLRDTGHDVLYLAEIDAGASDTEAMRRSQDEGRLLLTEDKDFGELAFRRRLAAPGLILLRIEPAKRHIKADRLESAVTQFGQQLFGRYTVVEENRFRMRTLVSPLSERD